MSRAAPHHGIFASSFGLLLIVIPGTLYATVALFHDIFPAPFGLVRIGDLSEAVVTARALTMGVLLLALGWGLLSFSRWAWYGYLAWMGVTVYGLSQTLFAGEAWITFEGLSILMPLALPYLWRRRRDFGVGARSAHTSGG